MAIGAAIAAALPMIGGAISGIVKSRREKKNQEEQARQNELDRQHEMYMYTWQRKDAIADWEREAAYNSPEEQMNRLRQAGLNPNLVYGKGADNTMSSVKNVSPTPSSKPYRPIDTNIFGDSLSKYYQLQNIQANTDNLAQQIALSKEEALVKKATVAKAMQETAMTGFQLQQAMELKDEVVRQAQLNNLKTQTDIEAQKVSTIVALERNEREKLANTANVEKTIQEILTSKLHNTKVPHEIEVLKTQIENAKKEGVLKSLDINLKEKGVQPSDPIYWRIVSQLLSSMGDGPNDYSPEEIEENVKRALQEYPELKR